MILKSILQNSLVVLGLGSFLALSACSTAYKQRQAERDKIASSSGLYCEFVNGDSHNDLDVELNLQMAKKCDVTKHFSITNYKNASDIFGVVYCCGAAAKKESSAPVSTPVKDSKSSAPSAPAKPSTPATNSNSNTKADDIIAD